MEQETNDMGMTLGLIGYGEVGGICGRALRQTLQGGHPARSIHPGTL
jgi:hypothetical protein